jgi:hypothetical protein
VEVGRFGRVAFSGDMNSMLRFQLERGGNGTKHCRKMKCRQRARLGSMRRKSDMAQRCDDVDRTRGSTEEGKREEPTLVGLT